MAEFMIIDALLRSKDVIKIKKLKWNHDQSSFLMTNLLSFVAPIIFNIEMLKFSRNTMAYYTEFIVDILSYTVVIQMMWFIDKCYDFYQQHYKRIELKYYKDIYLIL